MGGACRYMQTVRGRTKNINTKGNQSYLPAVSAIMLHAEFIWTIGKFLVEWAVNHSGTHFIRCMFTYNTVAAVVL